MTTASSPIELVVADRIGTIWLNRPERGNGIELGLATALRAAAFDLERDASVKVVVIRGRGANFSVGGDLRAFSAAGATFPRLAMDIITAFHDALVSLRRSGKPAIAAVHGACAGGAMSLALACDFVLAADTAHFSVAYRRLGVPADGGMSHSLTRLAGPRRALELMLLSDRTSASEALSRGLITRVCAEQELEAELTRMARALADNSPAASRAVKALVWSADTATFDEQLSAELASFVDCASSADFREGMKAFNDRRPPIFAGE
ncbi:enoyl-CoA hydratase-related protein [Bradyrhizobium sp. BRP56]|uniref:enoyl-CoA hydratase/isomerase family protein n=1 Tax=Bradyrhizobium sp. BRP56 TaxID=2793819 RepID=UPI001CD374BB|nr:enoyl-CoA hydratase/isomerase family protein [Bradyrhizobium sp. BRP56]